MADVDLEEASLAGVRSAGHPLHVARFGADRAEAVQYLAFLHGGVRPFLRGGDTLIPIPTIVSYIIIKNQNINLLLTYSISLTSQIFLCLSPQEILDHNTYWFNINNLVFSEF